MRGVEEDREALVDTQFTRRLADAEQKLLDLKLIAYQSLGQGDVSEKLLAQHVIDVIKGRP